MHSRDPPDRVRHLLHPAPGRAAAARAATSTPTSRIRPVPEPEKLYREITEVARGLGRQAHASGRHGRLVPVRRHRLDRDRRPGQAAQPEPAHVHDRVRARGLSARSTSPPSRPRRSASSTSPRSSPPQEMMDDAAADRLVPRRPGGRPGAGAAVLHRPRGPQARQGRAVRRGRRRAVRRLHDLPRADLAARVRLHARPLCGVGSARWSTRSAEGMRGKDLLRRGVDRHRGALLRQRAHLPPGRDERGRTPVRPGDVVSWTSPGALYAATEHLDGSTRMQYVDLFTWLRGDILVKADKMTMANSLELRVPFLDIEVFAGRLVDPDRPQADQGARRSTRCGGRSPTSCRRTCSTGPSSASRCRSGTGSRT